MRKSQQGTRQASKSKSSNLDRGDFREGTLGHFLVADGFKYIAAGEGVPEAPCWLDASTWRLYSGAQALEVYRARNWPEYKQLASPKALLGRKLSLGETRGLRVKLDPLDLENHKEEGGN